MSRHRTKNTSKKLYKSLITILIILIEVDILEVYIASRIDTPHHLINSFRHLPTLLRIGVLIRTKDSFHLSSNRICSISSKLIIKVSLILLNCYSRSPLTSLKVHESLTLTSECSFNPSQMSRNYFYKTLLSNAIPRHIASMVLTSIYSTKLLILLLKSKDLSNLA